ncbi:MAG: lysine 2,3-aminomutase [Phototrophicales bacterium]|nr:MAG: lysine 2,3-aminomutase [Phototrophicales bacterium]
MEGTPPKYRAFTLQTFQKIPQIARLSKEEKFAIKVVGNVLPFRVNNYVIEELIDWDNYQDDPIFTLTFPQKGMLIPTHFNQMATLLKQGASSQVIHKTANAIRMQLNPHPAGQIEHNVPQVDGIKLTGVQHKYRETVLFFPSQGQTCHAYCSFCFRWPQFVGIDELKFAMKETQLLIKYLRQHPEVTDILFTGGDPMIMRTKAFASYIEPILQANLPNIKTIRIGTKSLSYWPYRFLTDSDADAMLDLFKRIVDSGIHLAIMAHFNHPRELQTHALEAAVERIRSTGAQIRTQSPILAHINDDAKTWATMWQQQVNLGMIPYYMFIVRDTGAQHFFGIPLVRAWEIFRDAYKQVSGICRTVRGPSASAKPGKIQILGVTQVAGKKVIAMRFIQGRNPNWVHRPFFGEYDDKAIWPTELSPAFGEKQFFFEQDEKQMLVDKQTATTA